MNKSKSLLFISLLFLFVNCSGQQPVKDTLFIPELKWRLNVPAFLVSENKEEWKKVQDAGLNAVGDTYHVQVKNKVKTIFIFKSKDGSFFEAVTEPISKKEAEQYDRVCERMNDIVYNTVKNQYPSAQIDTTKAKEMIDNLPFQALKVKVTLPNGLSKTSALYRRVFKDTELTVSAMYMNEASGQAIITAIKNSTFEDK